MLVRGISLSMMGLFIPVFLFNIGFALTSILLVIIFYFLTRTFADYVSAFLVARFGPKHILFVGQIMFLLTSVLFLTLESMNWPLWFIGSFWGISQSMFFIAFDTDFSKIKHSDHSGKELSYILIMSKVGAFIGPILGGLVGYFVGPSFIFAFSSVAMMLGLIPLFKTKEPTHTKQHLDYASFDISKVSKNVPSFLAVNIENTISVTLWPLFLGVFVFIGNSAFINIGIITSIATLVSIITSYKIGQFVDAGNGRPSLRISSLLNSAVHFLRVLTSSYPVALSINILHDILAIGFRLPYYKGYYNNADNYPGHRIVFLSIMESIASFTKLTVYCLLFVVAHFVSVKTTLTLSFIIAGMASLLINTEKFRALDKDAKRGH